MFCPTSADLPHPTAAFDEPLTAAPEQLNLYRQERAARAGMTARGAMTARLSRVRPGALIVLACFLVQAVGVPNLAFARVIPRIVLPVRTVTVKKKVVECTGDESDGFFQEYGTPANQGEASPALIGAPTFSSGNRRPTTWGIGWFSENDQSMAIASDASSIVWTDGSGNNFTFLQMGVDQATQKPIYSNPLVYSTFTVVSMSGSIPSEVTLREADGTTRTFSPVESASVLRLTQLADRNGNTVSYTRDVQGRLTRVTDIHGRYFALTYNEAGLVGSVTDQGSRTTTYTYDAQSRRTGESGPLGTFSYAYDTENRMTRVTYPNGGERNYTYDSQGRVLTEDDGNGNNRLTHAYNATAHTVTDALGRATVNEYVERLGVKRLSRVVDPAGGITSFTYDSKMNLASRTDPRGNVTRYTYDAQGNLTGTEDAAGGHSLTSYELIFNQVVSRTDPLNHTTLMVYDQKGNLTRITDPLSYATERSYDSFGHVSQEKDPLNGITAFTYEPTNGAMASVTDPLTRVTAMQTDPLSRVVRNTDPAGKVTQYAYDAAGDLTDVTDALGQVTHYTYDPGRQTKLLASVQDALNHTTSFGYDSLGRRTSVTNALGQSRTSTYDAKGNLISSKNARNQETTYGYDSLDRLTSKTMPEGTVNYTYDAAGNLTNVTHPNGSVVAMTYDSLNRMTQSVQTLPGGFSATIGYSYDANGNRSQMTTPWGNFTYQYDANDRLTRLEAPQQKVFTFAYDGNGRRTSLGYPNGITAAYGYDSAGQLLSLTHTRNSDAQVIASAAYTYDAAGNRTSMQDWAGTHSYGHDDLHRLVSASHPAGSGLDVQNETFSHDAVGNRLTDARTTGYQYDAANRLTENASYIYTHDADGNLTGKKVKATNDQTTYTYDSQNTLTSTTLPDGTQWTYKYDGQGRRIEKRSGPAPSQIFRYVYDKDNILAIVDGAGTPLVVYTNGLGIDEPLMLKDSAGAYYSVHADPLESVIAHADSAGNLVERVAYEAYGFPVFTDMRGGTPSPEPNGSFTGSPLAFTGRVWDAERRQYDYRNRQVYDPETGRFGQEDPAHLVGGFLRTAVSSFLLGSLSRPNPLLDGAELGTLNQYQYAFNGPGKWMDPWGLSPLLRVLLPLLWLTENPANAPKAGDPTYLPVISDRDLEMTMALGAAYYAPGVCRGINQNRYLRLGPGRHAGWKWLRFAGQWVEKITGKPHKDLFKLWKL